MAAGGVLIVGCQAVQFSVLARVFAQTQRLLPPSRRRLSDFVDRITIEIGLVGGAVLTIGAVAGITASLLLSRSSNPHAAAAFRLGACSVVVGVLGLQLGATFLSILKLNRLGGGSDR